MDITLEMAQKMPPGNPGFDHREPKFNEQEELSKALTWSAESVPRVR
jgi:hypothetical protein